MEVGILLEYGWILLVLIALEGLLAADNALVLAIMVKHLPPFQIKKALFYGLAGALVFRFTSLFIISYLVNLWELQAVGAAYLLFMAFRNIHKQLIEDPSENEHQVSNTDLNPTPVNSSSFWLTVLKVEVADIAFAVDSILAAVAMAVSLPSLHIGKIGGMDAGQFLVVFTGGFIGLVIMRFAASAFVEILHRKPGLETAAFLIVGWVGVKLLVMTLAHPALAIISEEFAHSVAWKVTFYAVIIIIAVLGWVLSKERVNDTQ